MVTKSFGSKATTRIKSASLSPRTRKVIETLPTHAQHIYLKAHDHVQAVRPLRIGAEAITKVGCK